MKYIIFSTEGIDLQRLYPFSLTRSVPDITLGMMSIRERWEKALQVSSFDENIPPNDIPAVRKTRKLNELAKTDTVYYIKANLLPSAGLLAKIKRLKPGDTVVSATNEVLVALLNVETIIKKDEIKKSRAGLVYHDLLRIEYPWDIFRLNREVLQYDFSVLTKGRKSTDLGKTSFLTNKKQIFVEEGAVVDHAFINATEGPVYLSKGALIMEGASIRGPVYVGKNAVVKMGARIYGATTIGPNCVVGGEVKNSVLFANSNKGHDGYLGDAVIGEWCNLGAGTSNSNLKNTAENITVHLQGQKYQAGLKCGVLMGDYVRTAINTSINTGTVIGISANVFGVGLTPKEIPSFAWGTNTGETYRFDKVIKDIRSWKGLKGEAMTKAEEKMITTIYKNLKKN